MIHLEISYEKDSNTIMVHCIYHTEMGNECRRVIETLESRNTVFMSIGVQIKNLSAILTKTDLDVHNRILGLF